MSKVRDIISYQTLEFYTKQQETAEARIITTERILIQNDIAVLTVPANGDLVNNSAYIYDDLSTNVISMQATCMTDGWNVLFYPEDMLNGKYCVVSYVTNVVDYEE